MYVSEIMDIVQNTKYAECKNLQKNVQIRKVCKTEPVVRSKEMLYDSVAPLASMFVPRSLGRAMMRKTL